MANLSDLSQAGAPVIRWPSTPSPTSATTMVSDVATRRSDRRTATVAEIKDAAWAEVHASGSGDCSLRAVARRLGMAPSAL